MKKAKLFVFLIALTFIACSGDQYPELKDGLYARVKTNKGTMIIELFYDKAPATVANFVSLAEGTNPLADSIYKKKAYYDGLTFHRILKEFMIQGGDPEGTGMGGPGYKFHDEFNPELKHDTIGLISMANSGYGTNGSQFFITLAPSPHLDAYNEAGELRNCENPKISCHSIFGKVVEGYDVLQKIANVEMLNPATGKPKVPVKIEEVEIIRNGKEARFFDAPKVFTREIDEKEKLRKKAEEEARKRKEVKRQEFEKFRKEADSLPSGLTYVITKSGSETKPKRSQRVRVNYAGYFADGELFDTNIKEIADSWEKQTRPQPDMYEPVKIPYGPEAEMISGFKEGIQQLNYGDKAVLFIPYYLGYGERGYRIIPPRTNLVFEIELLEDPEEE
ncbi:MULTISPECIES: peptidylprolyl isomerase [unclassified Leeuwenhoekiella]|uniref:peptidylprolyl isomerase n=1 Tax=unclassified Leeuwenhoekiella TaxID=2615029 RepID=UPI000C3A16B3|nr:MULTISPECIES: peptidylprolyl isomerase [unclassified Leeuwenhoekiella]MAW94578.1 peptidylprolyl isomerase [Leeuwenhoekiella sp.]MBA82001.1 peptidylprolyl isomerase [Leeuwenhoekiella sp.]|tara:strand:- start:20734 stop:21906 length:1173 start_codon:yes stop_codon:yes gene_type:complete